MKAIILGSCICVLLAGAMDGTWAAQVLSDEEMDQVTAGALSVGMTDGKLNFLLGGDKLNGLSVEGSGTVATSAIPVTTVTPGSYIIMRDNAQSNLHALVNVNAINSKVNVLLNLTVNINSTVGAIHQTNTIQGL